MTRYYFHIRQGARRVEDLEGEPFASIEAAMVEAGKAAQELLIAAIQTGRWIDEERIEVCDDAGSVVGCINLIDLLPIRK